MRNYRLSDDDLKALNRWLAEKYGRGYYVGGQRVGEHIDQLWRIAWSDDLLEHRFGLFRDVDKSSGILLREVRETREVPKYGFIKSRYVLEKNVYAPSPELPDSQGKPHYELVFVFWDAETQEPIPIMREGIEFLINCLNDGAAQAAKNAYWRTQEQTKAEMDKDGDDFEKQALDELNQEYSPLATALADREAVVVPGKKEE